MEKTIYIRMQLSRRIQYQLATELRQLGDQRFFVKRALNPAAQPFLEALFRYYEQMCLAFPSCHILEPCSHNDMVRFEVVSAPTFAHIMAQAALVQERGVFVSTIQRFASILSSARVGSACASQDTEFSRLVGNSLKQSDEILELGAVDLCFDNILDTSAKPTIIDYEWIFPFAVPKAYVAFRAVVGLYGRIANRKPERICTIAEALELAGVKSDDFDRFAAYEDAFEELTSGRNSNFSDTFKKMLSPGADRIDPNRTSIVLRLAEIERECERKQAWILKIEKDYQELKASIDARSTS